MSGVSGHFPIPVHQNASPGPTYKKITSKAKSGNCFIFFSVKCFNIIVYFLAMNLKQKKLAPLLFLYIVCSKSNIYFNTISEFQIHTR